MDDPPEQVDQFWAIGYDAVFNFFLFREITMMTYGLFVIDYVECDRVFQVPITPGDTTNAMTLECVFMALDIIWTMPLNELAHVFLEEMNSRP